MSLLLTPKSVKFWWDYVWGKFDNGVFFHSAFFDVIQDNGRFLWTHSSLHTPEPSYFETINDTYPVNKNGRIFTTNNTAIFCEYGKDEDVYKDCGRIHTYATDVSVYGIYTLNCFKSISAHGRGWTGKEESDENWAGLIYEKDGKPEVDNWEWVAVKLDNHLNVMMYKKRRSEHCRVIKDGKAEYVDTFYYSNNLLQVPRFDLNITIVPIADESIFKSSIGMDYSEQFFNVVSNQGTGYGIREKTYGVIGG